MAAKSVGVIDCPGCHEPVVVFDNNGTAWVARHEVRAGAFFLACVWGDAPARKFDSDDAMATASHEGEA